jgi:hypothetical protein
MFYEETIMNEGDEIPEGHIKIIALRTYVQESAKSEPAKYKMMFANYEIHFTNGGIFITLDIGVYKNPIHLIHPETCKLNMIKTGISHTKSRYILNSNTLSYESTDQELSWNLIFDIETNGIKVSNKDLPLFDLKFYSTGPLGDIEIQDGIEKIKGDIALQPLIKNHYEQTDGMKIIQYAYNKHHIRFNKLQENNTEKKIPCRTCSK